MSEKKTILKPEVLEASDFIQAGISLDSKTGDATVKDDLFSSFAEKHDLTMDVVDKVDDVRTTFSAGGVHAIGTLAVDAMASNKKLERVSVEVPVGKKDVLTVAVDRHKSFTNHLTGGEATEKYAVVTSQYDFHAGKNAGQLKKARTLIAELGMEKLK